MIRKFYEPRSTEYLDFKSLSDKIDSKVIEVDEVTQEKNGLMSKEDKVKLDSIEENANNYVHPITHTASMIEQDSTHRFVTDEEKSKWEAKATTEALNQVQTKAEQALAKAEEAFQSASNGKNLMASAITGMGVEASSSDSFEQLSNKVKQIKTKAIFS